MYIGVTWVRVSINFSMNDGQKFERQPADLDNLNDEGTVALNFS